MAPCASCGEETNKSWVGCMEALAYTDEEGKSVYCNHECQAAHQPDHQQVCYVREQRKKLLRIATVLKSTIVAYLECAFDRNYRSIVVTGDIIDILECQSALHRHIPFPSDLTTNMEDKVAALMFMQCDLSVTLISTLAKHLFKDHSFTAHVAAVKVVAERRLVIRVFREPGYWPEDVLTRSNHTVLLVTTKFGEQWVVDSSGCQYGFQDVLVPLPKYLEGKRLVGTPEPYEHHHEECDLDNAIRVRSSQLSAEWKELFALERPARLHFVEFIKTKILEAGGNFGQNLLSGSDKRFEEKLTCFHQEVKAHMTKYIEETYGNKGLEDLKRLSKAEVRAQWRKILGFEHNGLVARTPSPKDTLAHS